MAATALSFSSIGSNSVRTSAEPTPALFPLPPNAVATSRPLSILLMCLVLTLALAHPFTQAKSSIRLQPRLVQMDCPAALHFQTTPFLLTGFQKLRRTS